MAYLGGTNGFAALKVNRITRKYGTNGANSAEPYVGGYIFAKFTRLPWLATIMQNLGYNQINGGTISQDDVGKILSSTIQSITIPGRTLNQTEFPGLGGLSWGVPTNATEDNNISIRFQEFQDLPIHRIIHSWVKLIRDARSGLSLVGTNLSGSGTGYHKGAYSGSLYYWTLTPNGKDIQYSACYTGIYPTKDPSDLFGHDLGSNEKVEIDIDFHTDYCWQESWVKARCKALNDELISVDGGGSVSNWVSENYGRSTESF